MADNNNNNNNDDDVTSKPSYTLHVYYTRYSSWGARVQLVLAHFEIPHTVRYYNFTDPALAAPAGLQTLPVLDVAVPDSPPLRVADSLAICEFLAEQQQQQHHQDDRPLWPRDAHLRALARAAAARMHSGFAALRAACPSNFVARFAGPGLPARLPAAAAEDVRRLGELWGALRAAARERLALLGEADEGFLCGAFSIADAFFWPVLWRLRTYDVPLAGIGEDGLEWMATMWNDPVIRAQGREYFRQARDPRTRMPPYDDVFEGAPDVTSGEFTEDWVFEPSA